MAAPPQAVIIAGPNGSGKSTAATVLLPPGMTFINADLIAQELTGKPGTPGDINAGRILLDRIEGIQAESGDFAFETTLATKMLASRVERWRALGYQVHLIYIWLPSEDLAVERVKGRVRDGGHHVPEDTIRRRFRAGKRNFLRVYRPLADTWRVYDNSRADAPELIARGSRDGSLRVNLPEAWRDLTEDKADDR